MLRRKRSKVTVRVFCCSFTTIFLVRLSIVVIVVYVLFEEAEE